MKNVYKILLGKIEGKRTLTRPTCGWEVILGKQDGRFQQICGRIKRTSARKVRKETFLRFYKIMAITLLYGSECWTLTKR
jgi:hypothetical protein